MGATALYESERLLGEYLLLHYGTPEDTGHPSLPVPPDIAGIPFPVRCVRELLDPALLPDGSAALELGCSVGAAAFELARSCPRVEASDWSSSFIAAANLLKTEGFLESRRIVEGGRAAPFTAAVPEDIERARVTFSVQDATALPVQYGPFDVVLAANLLCRLPDPDALVMRLPSLVKPGGQLLLTTPFTWLEEFTPRERWIGGCAGASSEEELTRRLDPHFRLHRRADLPFLIREHERKYQLGIALGTSWIRR
jgi:SAM-dependent methyltransferase